MLRLRNVCVLFLLGVALTTTVAYGQVATGNISGNVTDTTGAVVSGAMVQVLNTETAQARNVTTDEGGHYEARNLALGPYSVTVQQTGFKTEVRSGITLNVGDDLVISVALTVGSVQQTVTVTTEAAAVETTNATVSGLVDEQRIRDLPLNGRSVDQLSLLTPGVQQVITTSSSLGGHGAQISVNGQRNTANLYLMDGTNVNNHNDGGPGSALGVQLGIDSILEFRVLTHDYSAEYGHSSGGVVSYVTRSGTNDYHGGIYEFLRNNALDARNYFNVNGSGAPIGLPPFRQNQFGAFFGGPARKNKIFFFANYEGVRNAQGVTNTAFVPDNNARNGMLPVGAGGAEVPVTFSAAAKPYVLFYPIANGANVGGGIAKFITNDNNTAAEDYVMGRVDYVMSDKDTIYGRYIYDASFTNTPGAIAPFGSVETGTDDLAVLSETHIFSPSKLNVISLAWNRTAPDATQNEAGSLFAPGEPPPFLPFGQGIGGITFNASPSGNSSSLTGYGAASFGFQYFPLNTIQTQDTFTLTHGKHTFKFGGDVERYQQETSTLPFAQGAYTFSGIQQFLAATPNQVRFSLPPGIAGSNSVVTHHYLQTLVAGFIEDDFRVTKNLTLNLGIREEFVTTPIDAQGNAANLVHFTDPTSKIGPPIESKHKLDPTPRFGLAWDPFGKGKTSVRFGSGLFLNENVGRLYYLEAYPEYRFLTQYLVKNPPGFPNALNSGYLTGAVSSVNTSENAHKPETQKTVQYNLGIQQQLNGTMSLEVGYVGSHSWNLQERTSEDLHIPTIVNGQDFFSASEPLQNPAFSVIDALRWVGESNYDALQVTFDKRFSHGLLLLAHYTYSQNLADEDDVATPNFVMNPFHPGLDYGPSFLRQKHYLDINGRYILPFGDHVNSKVLKEIIGGWELNGIYTLASGTPFNITTGFNRSADGDSNSPDRPNFNPGFTSGSDLTSGTTGAGCEVPGTTVMIPANQKVGTPARWFNPCAFSLPAAGFFGNVGRDSGIGPRLNSANMTLARNFSITERMKLELRGEFYNLFNHSNFSIPSVTGVFTNTGGGSYAGGAGSITTTRIPNRQTQVALKLTF